MSESDAAPRALPDVLLALHAGLVTFVGAGLIEAVLVVTRARGGLAGSTDAILTFVAAFGLGAAPGLLAALALASFGLPLLRAVETTVRDARADAERARATLARAIATLLASAIPITAVHVATGLAHGFARADLAAWFVALVCATAIAAALGAFPALSRGVEACLAHVVSRASGERQLAAGALAFVTIGVAFVGLATRGADFGAMRLDGLWMLGLASLAALGWLFVLRSRARLRRWNLGLSTGALVVGLAGAFVSLDAHAEIAGTLLTHGALSRLDLLGMRRLLDFDHDGYAASLAGGDCDDDDPMRHPDAAEIPDDGVDENCDGDDGHAHDPADDAHAESRPSGRAPRRDAVVLVLLDSLRPDHLGAYHYERATSPHLDAFAATACVFEVARSQAPNTPRSFPSILTGRYPSRLRWIDRDANFGDLEPGQPTLFDAFHDAGYRTEAVTAHPYFQSVHELRRNVDRWDDPGALSLEASMSASTAPDVTDRALARLEVLYADPQRPFFLFVHYSEPHGRYVAHAGSAVFGETPMDLYDGEIAFLDAHVGRLLTALSSEERSARTTVVVLSDHGEAFQEHGLGLHGRTVFEEELRVPLLVRTPGATPRRTPTPVALIDVFPTLAELTGADAASAQGVSLVRELVGETLPGERVIFAEQLPYASYPVHMLAAVQASLVLVRDITHGAAFAFDLAQDPHEQENRLPHEPERFATLVSTLAAFVDATP